jgi:hypothetical protein
MFNATAPEPPKRNSRPPDVRLSKVTIAVVGLVRLTVTSTSGVGNPILFWFRENVIVIHALATEPISSMPSSGEITLANLMLASGESAPQYQPAQSPA